MVLKHLQEDIAAKIRGLPPGQRAGATVAYGTAWLLVKGVQGGFQLTIAIMKVGGHIALSTLAPSPKKKKKKGH